MKNIKNDKKDNFDQNTINDKDLDAVVNNFLKLLNDK